MLSKTLSERDRRCFRCVLEVCDDNHPSCLWFELTSGQARVVVTLARAGLKAEDVASSSELPFRKAVGVLVSLKKIDYVLYDEGTGEWSLSKRGQEYVDSRCQVARCS